MKLHDLELAQRQKEGDGSKWQDSHERRWNGSIGWRKGVRERGKEGEREVESELGTEGRREKERGVEEKNEGVRERVRE